ncbi:MAG: LysM domain-containing protein [Solirubrobacteraceae bacterium]
MTAPLTGRAATTATVPVGWARLRSDGDPTLALLTELGKAFPRVVQGYGGWEEIELAGRTSITHWRGFKPMAIELELSLDNFAAGTSIELAIDMLEGLAGRGRRGTGGRPPLLVVDTAGVMPHDARTFPATRWVVSDDLEFSDDEDEIVVNHAGNRVLVNVTVPLLQHIDDSRLQDRALAARIKRRGTQKGSKRRYTVKQGDTLQSIARSKLGDAGRWRELQKLNPGVRDPRALRTGAVLRLP